jgi:hypothetical protein
VQASVPTAAASDFENYDAVLRQRWIHQSDRLAGVDWLQNENVSLFFSMPGEENMGKDTWRQG